jgi:hypothetical protein
MTMEGFMAPDASPTPPSVLTQPGSVEQLRRFAAGAYLYAITDGAYSAALIAHIEKTAPDNLIPLLHPHPAIEATAIPQLIKVSEPILETILSAADKTPWGIFVMTKADPETLRVHFRRFLVVQLPDGEHWYFRFYDPRLLPVYVGKCNEWELEKFFGPVRGFGIPAGVESGITVLHFEGRTSASVIGSATDPYMSAIWHIRPEQAQALESI